MGGDSLDSSDAARLYRVEQKVSLLEHAIADQARADAAEEREDERHREHVHGDIEVRLRALEKFMWMCLGISSTGALISLALLVIAIVRAVNGEAV